MAADSATIPWGAILAAGGTVGTLVAAAVGWGARVLITDRIKGADNERDTARKDLEDAKRERDEYKDLWKQGAIALRNMRRELERLEEGTASVPPPPQLRRKEFKGDETGKFQIDSAADRAWAENRERQRTESALEPLYQRYLEGETITTPPESFSLPRKKFPSRSR